MQGIRRREHANHKASSLFRKHALCSGRDGHDAVVYYDPQHLKKAVDNAVWLTKKQMKEAVCSASILAGVLSLLTGVAGLPEVKA